MSRTWPKCQSTANYSARSGRRLIALTFTSALKPGDNIVEIRVVNLWVNRLIGDAQPSTKKKVTFTARNLYKADSPLVPAGLLGPVRILLEEAAGKSGTQARPGQQ